MNRREFVTRMAAGAAALKTVSGARTAHAQGAVPKRVLFIFGGTGGFPGTWEPVPTTGNPVATETQWQLGHSMASLSRYHDQMITFENLDMVSCFTEDNELRGSGHDSGEANCLTAAGRISRFEAAGLSIDQLIANEINKGGPVTRLPSIFSATGGNAHPVWSGSGQGIEPIKDPRVLYDRLFPEELRPQPGDNAAALRAQQRRQMVLNLVQSDTDALVRKLPAAYRLKIEQHMDERSLLEDRLSLNTSAGEWPQSDIVTPWASSTERRAWTPGEVWSTNAELQLRLAVAALHADVTRVAVVKLTDCPGDLIGYTNGNYDTSDSHILQHEVNDLNSWQSQDTTAQAVVTAQSTRTFEKAAFAADRLAEMTEGDGSSLLDNTLLVFCSQIAKGDHDVDRLPWFTLGSMQGSFRTGRLLKFGRATRPDVPFNREVGRPHSDLWISVANAMGVNIERFGNMASTGPITEMA